MWGIERNVCYAGSAVLVHEMTSFRVGVCIDFGHFANCQGGNVLTFGRTHTRLQKVECCCRINRKLSGGSFTAIRTAA